MYIYIYFFMYYIYFKEILEVCFWTYEAMNSNLFNLLLALLSKQSSCILKSSCKAGTTQNVFLCNKIFMKTKLDNEQNRSNVCKVHIGKAMVFP